MGRLSLSHYHSLLRVVDDHLQLTMRQRYRRIAMTFSPSLIVCLFFLFATATQAQNIEVNIAGPLDLVAVGSEHPLTFCSANSPWEPLVPVHYVNGDIPGVPAFPAGTLHVWKCVSGYEPSGLYTILPYTIVRYSAMKSFDGLNKLVMLNNASFLDHTVLTGCQGPTRKTRTTDGKQYDEYVGCTGGVRSFRVTLALSEARDDSYHQTGPIGTNASVSVILGFNYDSWRGPLVPYSLVIGEGVYRVNSGLVQGPVSSLSLSQIQAILGRSVRDWQTIGLGTAPPNSSPGTPADTVSPITLCLQEAGSGVKAVLDETVTLIQGETSLGSTDLTNSADGVYFGKNSKDVRDCIGGNGSLGRPAHSRAIGYMSAHEVGALTHGYVVGINGQRAIDNSLSDPLLPVKCGKYFFVTYLRIFSNYPTYDQFHSVFVSGLSDTSKFTLMPSVRNYWLDGDQTNIRKDIEAGPIIYSSLPLKVSCVQ